VRGEHAAEAVRWAEAMGWAARLFLLLPRLSPPCGGAAVCALFVRWLGELHRWGAWSGHEG
jgi:hypothetical protein